MPFGWVDVVWMKMSQYFFLLLNSFRFYNLSISNGYALCKSNNIFCGLDLDCSRRLGLYEQFSRVFDSIGFKKSDTCDRMMYKWKSHMEKINAMRRFWLANKYEIEISTKSTVLEMLWYDVNVTPDICTTIYFSLLFFSLHSRCSSLPNFVDDFKIWKLCHNSCGSDIISKTSETSVRKCCTIFHGWKLAFWILFILSESITCSIYR